MAHAAVHVVQLFQAKQADAKGHEVGRFVALQGHAGCGLQAQGQKLFAVVHARVGGVAHHHAGRLKALGRHADQATAFHERAHFMAQLQLLGAHFFKAVVLGFQHHFAQARQCVCGHGGVVHVGAVLIGFHHLQPLLQVAGKAAAGGAINGGAGARAEHHHGAAGRSAPAFLRRGNQHVHAGGFHVHPDGARGNAVQHKQAAHLVHGVGHGAQVVVGQDHAGGCFYVRRKHHVGFFGQDGGDHFVNRAGHPRGLRRVRGAPRLEHDGLGRDVAHVKNLRPAVAKPAVADDERFFASGKLARHGFHAKRAAAGHQHGGWRVVDRFQDARDVAHDALKALRHVVQRTVGVDHRKL